MLSGVVVTRLFLEQESGGRILSQQRIYVDVSLFGKAPHCACGEQGSIPGVNR